MEILHTKLKLCWDQPRKYDPDVSSDEVALRLSINYYVKKNFKKSKILENMAKKKGQLKNTRDF